MPKKTENFKCPDCGHVHGSRSGGDKFRCPECKKQYPKAGNEAPVGGQQDAGGQTTSHEETTPKTGKPPDGVNLPPPPKQGKKACPCCGSTNFVKPSTYYRHYPDYAEAYKEYKHICMDCYEVW